ncbi:MAG: AraC family transcriptional regulator [Bacillota bacterium]|nr:AraC family transcriptional regulator [Bacillota bacterium]
MNVEVKNIVAGEDVIRTENIVSYNSMPYISLFLCVSGKIRVNYGEKKTFIINSKECFLLPSNTKLKISAIEKSQVYHIFINVLIDGNYYLEQYYVLPSYPISSNLEAHLLNCYELSKENTIYESFKFSSILYSFLADLIYASKPKNSGIPSKLIPAVEYITSNLSQNIFTSDLAAICNMSESSMYKLFRKALGKSPKQYILCRRLERAALMLAETKKSIADISEETGFYDQFYFSKEFKKHFEITPIAYRKANK